MFKKREKNDRQTRSVSFLDGNVTPLNYNEEEKIDHNEEEKIDPTDYLTT